MSKELVPGTSIGNTKDNEEFQGTTSKVQIMYIEADWRGAFVTLAWEVHTI